MKKILAVIIVFIFAFSGLLTGCKKLAGTETKEYKSDVVKSDIMKVEVEKKFYDSDFRKHDFMILTVVGEDGNLSVKEIVIPYVDDNGSSKENIKVFKLPFGETQSRMEETGKGNIYYTIYFNEEMYNKVLGIEG